MDTKTAPAGSYKLNRVVEYTAETPGQIIKAALAGVPAFVGYKAEKPG